MHRILCIRYPVTAFFKLLCHSESKVAPARLLDQNSQCNVPWQASPRVDLTQVFLHQQRVALHKYYQSMSAIPYT